MLSLRNHDASVFTQLWRSMAPSVLLVKGGEIFSNREKRRCQLFIHNFFPLVVKLSEASKVFEARSC